MEKVLEKNKKDFFDSKNLFSSKCLAKRTQIDTQDHIINYATAYLYISLRTHICRVSPKFKLSTACSASRGHSQAERFLIWTNICQSVSIQIFIRFKVSSNLRFYLLMKQEIYKFSHQIRET